MGVRVILTEILVFATGLTLLIWAVTAEPFVLKILGGALFVFFVIFGYQLVRSVIKEIELRAELEKAYDELERIDRAKTEFLSMASHQLRTPLGIIRGYISMMLEGDYGEFPKEAKMRLENTLISSERLVKLVNDLLDITRLEMGKIELKLERASIEEIISGVIEEMKPAAEKKGLYLKWEKPATALPEMSLDKNKIRQVILNLVDNGIKYTQKGGVTVKGRRMNSEVRIEVRDTGVGMSKEEIENLFEIMARGRAGLQYWMQGVGLGLYTARKFVEMHGGRVWAESPGKDKGSTFYIELPIK
jgi:signal transduction histidine kinase